MPEIAEVAINRDWLSSRLVGKQLRSMVFHPHSRHDIYGLDTAQSDLRGLVTAIRHYRVVEVGSKGKLLYIHLHADSIPPMRAHVDRYLHINHGMSGGWKYPTFGGPWDGLGKHDAWSITTQGGQETTYYDARRFGTLKLLNSAEHLEALEKLGPDVLTATQEQIYGSIGGGSHNQTIRQVLLNQNRVSGIGNYLVSEILYRASVNPARKLGDVYIGEIQRIAFMAQVAAKDSYNYGGCTLHSWRNPEGGKGGYQTRLSVYGKTHCPLAHPVSKSKDKQGRTIWSCPTCQT